ncbi:MAG: TIGR02281 family clan AA aspartic protease [Hyphomicrobiaceae bacterium]|nr:MAG: TIGR02281 family clan AA aspartic protease [Hyphomicrobiaceae bacterium]
MLSPAARHALGQGAMWLSLLLAGLIALGYLKQTAQSVSEVKEARASSTEIAEQVSDAKPAVSRGQTIELKADARGHFLATAHISGRPVRVLVDTGATTLALKWEDAMAAGLHVRESDFTIPVNTANGLTHVAPLTIDRVSLGDIEVRNVQAAVTRPGALHITLLGMSFLKKLERVDFRGRTLVLSQ